jgi:Ca2+-binding RTX toxin-like protein
MPRRAALLAVVVPVVLLLGAAEASASITVSTSGDELRIASTNNVLGTTVSYNLGPTEFQVSDGGTATTSDADCHTNGSSIVICEDNGEDVIDVTFGTSGGSVNLDTISGLVPGRFSSSVTLGNGSDIVDGTDGDDVVAATSPSTVNADTIRGRDGDDTITTGNGSDIIDGGNDADTIVASGGNNILNGGEFADDDAGDGNDTITGGPVFDIIDGGLGDDILNGGTDADTSDSGDFDQIDGRRGNDTINAGDGPDTDVDGGPGNDVVNGDDGNDALFGGSNASNPQDSDTLNGGPGADVLLNSPGPDTFNGGTNVGGTDEVEYSQTSGSAPIKADIDGASGDDGTNCEVGPCEGDTIATDVEDLTGDGGDDLLTGSSVANTVDGGPGDDMLAGGTGVGADGADRFIGGSNSDTVDYTARNAAVVVSIDGTANDGAGGCPSGAGCEGDDVETDVEDLIGGGAGDTLTGSAGPNQLFGGFGVSADTLNGLGGDDTLVGGDRGNGLADGADVFSGGANSTGGDTVSYSHRTAAITASLNGVADDTDGDNVGTDVENLNGGTAGDTLSGNTSANTIDGNGGNDTISGGTGSATDGDDALIGDTGSSDTVSYAPRTGDLDVDLDGVADDGEGAEADDIDATVENVTGGAGDDDITGSVGANTLSGGGGDDDLIGGPGTNADAGDTLIGGANGTAGGQNSSLGDTAQYNARTDALVLSIGDGANDGGGGCPAGAGCEDDDIQASVENLRGGTNGDTLTGDGSANGLNGNGGDDTLRGGAGTGPDGADTFVPGPGTDLVSYSNRTDPIDVRIGGAPNTDGDSLDTGTENVTGGSGNDTLRGGSTDNVLSGGSGNDTLFGGQGTGPDGADTFFAGPNAGDDTVSYANRSDAIYADLEGATPHTGGSNGAEGDSISSTIDNLTGGSGSDDLFGDEKPNRIEGGPGDDDLVTFGDGAGGPDGADVWIGGPGNLDRLIATARTDGLTYSIGGGANDSDGDDLRDDVERVATGAGADTLMGTGDAETFESGNGADTITPGLGADTVDAGDGTDVVNARDGVTDTINCGTLADSAVVDSAPADALTACETVDAGPFVPPVDPPVDPPVVPGDPPVDPGDPACDAAKAKLAKAKAKVKKARAAVAKADAAREEAQAKARLKKAKKGLTKAKASVKAEC